MRNMGKVSDSSTFSDNDWEEVRYKTDSKIKEWINDQLKKRSCLVVLVGAKTSERKWVKYEIEKAMELNKGIVGIRINRLKDSMVIKMKKDQILFILSLRKMVIDCLIM